MMKNHKKKIEKVAIANRGEVAVRIATACRELGIKTVLLHSEPDVKTRAFRMTDEQICIGPAATNESYLNIQANIQAALKMGADAVHPGFGFLSENADFADACRSAGLIFIGPRGESIRALGDKISAKKLIMKANVPTVPGYMGERQDVETLIARAEEMGWPVIVKAAAGGGGRGMKVIRSKGEAADLISSAQREAQSAFGSPIVFLEKYLDRAKHIEVQVFGDSHGNVVHLFERECTVQRRHQKIVEEATAASLPEQLRKEMTLAAVRLAQEARYEGAGTVEFLVQDGRYYFLEMNTRLQVEHPVTEMVLGVDLVKAQVLNAAGEFKVWPQDELSPRGHAIECRIYAEDAYAGGIPSTGLVGWTHWPEGPGRRFEVGVEEGDEVTPFYDSMIAKVIVWDETRARAIQKMDQVLRDTIVFGVKLNVPYLRAILAHPDFTSGQMTTQFITKYFPDGIIRPELSAEMKQLLEAGKKLGRHSREGGRQGAYGVTGGSAHGDQRSPWNEGWRLV